MRKCKSAGIQKKNWQMGQTTSDWSKTESKKIVRRSCDEEQNLQTDDLLNVQEKISEKSDSRSSSKLRRTAERDLAMSNMSSFRTFRTISPCLALAEPQSSPNKGGSSARTPTINSGEARESDDGVRNDDSGRNLAGEKHTDSCGAGIHFLMSNNNNERKVK